VINLPRYRGQRHCQRPGSHHHRVLVNGFAIDARLTLGGYKFICRGANSSRKKNCQSAIAIPIRASRAGTHNPKLRCRQVQDPTRALPPGSGRQGSTQPDRTEARFVRPPATRPANKDKFDRACIYCDLSNFPLQIEQIISRARGRSELSKHHGLGPLHHVKLTFPAGFP
jgi:hypothetical protein